MRLAFSQRSLVAILALIVVLVGIAFFRLSSSSHPPPAVFDRLADRAAVDDAVAPPSLLEELALVEGEHPLTPALRLARRQLRYIDTKIRDYACTLTKRQRVDGELMNPQSMQLMIRHAPLSIYMRFTGPLEGQECLYVQGQNKDKMLARASDWRRAFGVLRLNPHGPIAMGGQRHPIMRTGIRHLLVQLIQVAQAELERDECLVTIDAEVEVDNRPATLIEIRHPVRRPNFEASLARVYIDNELRLPVRYGAWSWPEEPGHQPPLEEEYIYTNVRINNGFSDQTFSRRNPEIFRK